MEKTNIPQDDLGLNDNKGRELCYATDENGDYTTGLSLGWEAKGIPLIEVWRDVRDTLIKISKEIEVGEASPLKFYMQYNLMDSFLVAASVGIATWRVKLHLMPFFYNRMNDTMTARYAKELGLTVDNMKNSNHITPLNISELIKEKSGLEL
ncbi:MAG: hypothetical protein JKY53_10860 [Flavobacteriales bacterium]|nr:hypothetical protein [Flavobacteriales bacterium]